MATRTKGKSVVSGRPGIIDHQNNPTNTRLVDDQHGRNLIRKNFHPRLNTTGPPQLPPLKTSNKSVQLLPKFCILKIWKWIIQQRSGEIGGGFCAFQNVQQQQMALSNPVRMFKMFQDFQMFQIFWKATFVPSFVSSDGPCNHRTITNVQNFKHLVFP